MTVQADPDTHEQTACVAQGIAAAESYCLDHKLQFTAVRRRVLEHLLVEHRALGAYEILDRLREEGLGKQPPIAYRALDFLVEHGFAHRIERLNAFVACGSPGRSHSPVFLICRKCKRVVETTAAVVADKVLGEAAKSNGFAIHNAVVEAEGTCTTCVSDTDLPEKAT
ncbi:MAG: transcriptional repressor [Pseudomonadota bacterium]